MDRYLVTIDVQGMTVDEIKAALSGFEGKPTAIMPFGSAKVVLEGDFESYSQLKEFLGA